MEIISKKDFKEFLEKEKYEEKLLNNQGLGFTFEISITYNIIKNLNNIHLTRPT